MIDAITDKPLQVTDTDGGPAIFDVPARQVEEIQRLLSAHGIRYWVDEDYFSFEGGPETTIIYFGHAGDSKKVQSILDNAG